MYDFFCKLLALTDVYTADYVKLLLYLVVEIYIFVYLLNALSYVILYTEIFILFMKMRYLYFKKVCLRIRDVMFSVRLTNLYFY